MLLLQPPLLFICKGHDLKAHNIPYSDPGHTRLKQKLEKKIKITFLLVYSKKATRKKKKGRTRKAIVKCFELRANTNSSSHRDMLFY